MARQRGNLITAQGVTEISNALQQLPGRGMMVVSARAVNKTLRGARTDASKMIRQELHLKARDVRRKLTTKPAPYGRNTGYKSATGILNIGARPVPLARYPFRPTSPPSQKGVSVSNRKPTTVHVLKRGARKKVQSGFVAKMKSGHVGVFMRDGEKRKMQSGRFAGKKRQPIRELYGPGPGVHFRRNIMQRRLGRKVMPRLYKNLNHELNYYIRQQFRRMAKKGLSL